MARVSGLRGDIGTLRALKNTLALMPRSVAVDVAAKSAPEITRLAQESFDSGVDVYGRPRKAGVKGQALDLVKTGAVRREMRFTASDTRVVCTIGPNYARFLIGKYVILPIGDRSRIPASWLRVLDNATKESLDVHVRAFPRSTA